MTVEELSQGGLWNPPIRSALHSLRQTPMTFVDALIASGYVFDEKNYDGCYVKQDSDGFIHCYQEGEDEGEWNYVKMNQDFDVISEVTFDPDSNFIV